MIPLPPSPSNGLSVPAAVAQGLRDHDSHLAVTWNERDGRWGISFYVEQWKFWSHIVYWEGPTAEYPEDPYKGPPGKGSFRDLPATADPLIKRLGQCIDSTKLGVTDGHYMDKINAKFDNANRILAERREAAKKEIGEAYREDLIRDRVMSAPGYIRSRVGYATGSENHRKAIEEIDSADF